MLYPFEWQHVFIPLLPKQMMTFVCAPMPFIVGLLEPFLNDLVEYLEMLEEVDLSLIVLFLLTRELFEMESLGPHSQRIILRSF
tara:strand:+ start:2158 stop:2409 length:252 start_codon:yes stop_codon:yes gene_type:complete